MIAPRPSIARAVTAAALAAAFATSLVAQAPPGGALAGAPARAAAAPGEGGPADARMALGRAALAAGRHGEAVAHFSAALTLHPASPAILREVLGAVAGHPDALALWAHRYWRAVADGRGRARIERDVQKLLGDADARAKSLAQARATALAELARWSGKLDDRGRAGLGAGLSARWAADVARVLLRDAPNAASEHAAAFDAACARFAPDHRAVLAALERVMQNPPRRTRSSGSGDEVGGAESDDAALRREQSLALRAARCLSGLAAQAGFDDLEGPPAPDLGTAAANARAVIERLRDSVASRIGHEWTVEELQRLTEAEREQFTQAHADWANPGIAISPKGRYQIQTVCGFETLLGAAETVEYHHDRLAHFFGKDPFDGRRGVVVIVPEHSGLEEEGAPYWWAGGFQSGDRTTIRFAWSDVPGMGRTLTHELTHRFDAALFPFQPSWLVEGKAVWTARSYARMRDGEFLAMLLSPGAIAEPFVKGYGDERELQKLVEGTIDDYRDNYSAGSALYTYLATWPPDGPPRYRERLERFMKNARAGRQKPLQFFESTFCDGADGRPDGFAAFAQEFGEFLRQCYRWSWSERDSDNRFVQGYRLDRGKTDPTPLVMDRHTWSWARDRAEPWFGQRHAALAGALLAEVGEHEAAAAALLWSLTADGWQAAELRTLRELLASLGRDDAAWVAAREARVRFPTAGDAPLGEAPQLRSLPKLRALLTALADTARGHASAGQTWAARAVANEHDELAALVGAAALTGVPPAPEPDPLCPERALPLALGLGGFVETGLTGYEERRVEGLWFETPTADLHVGRNREREDTGSQDRRAHQRHAFVRSAEWQPPGEYVLRARVHFTTSFVAGAIVLGYTRRDRNVRIDFSAGDFLYAIGRSEQDHETDAVNLAIEGLWERDGRLPGSSPRNGWQFERPSSWFDVEAHVRGPSVVVSIMGEPWLRYTTPDGTPIEGAIGFAMRQGAVRIQEPTVQRLDSGNLRRDSADAQRTAVASVGFDLLGGGIGDPEDLALRPVRDVPLSDHGTILVVVPAGADGDDAQYLGERALRRLARYAADTVGYPQRWVVALPDGLPGENAAAIGALASEMRAGGFETVGHRLGPPFDEEAWVVFVDGGGILRAAITSDDIAIAQRVERWARLYRKP